MDPALVARFARTGVQRASANAEEGVEALLRAKAAVGLGDARKAIAVTLAQIYAAVEASQFGALQRLLKLLVDASAMLDDEGDEHDTASCVVERAATLEGAPSLLAGALAYLLRRTESAKSGASAAVKAAAAACSDVSCVLAALLRPLRYDATTERCATCAAALADAARQVAGVGGVAALAHGLALGVDEVGTSMALSITLYALKREGVALPPAALAALADEAFVARLPVLVGGTYQTEAVTAAASLVALVAWFSPAAAAALVQPTRRPPIMPLLLAAVDIPTGLRTASQRPAAAGAIGALARGAGVLALVHLPWAFETLAEAVLSSLTYEGLREALSGIAPFAREPCLRAAVASDPSKLHEVAAQAAALNTLAHATKGARQLMLMLLTCDDPKLPLIAHGALLMAPRGASVLAELAATRPAVAELASAPHAARRALAALADAERNTARGRTGVFAVEAWRNDAVLQPFEAMPAAELRAHQNDEAWCVAMRRDFLMMHLGRMCRSLMLRSGRQRTTAKDFADAVCHAAAAAAIVVRDMTEQQLVTAGLFAVLHAPELRLVFRGGAGGDALATKFGLTLLESAISALVERFEELRRVGDADQARGLLLREGLELPDRHTSACVLLTFLTGIPGNARAGRRSAADASRLIEAAAADEDEQGRVAIVWLFKQPRKGSPERAQMDDSFRQGYPIMLASSIPPQFAAPLKRNAPVPALQCDVRACLEPLYAAAARRPGGPAAALLSALLAHAAANDPAARVLDPCVNCDACRSARRTGVKCALPACRASRVNGATLKRCGRCLTAAYCSNECQMKDLARHKREDCTPPDA